jgi:hypothetical protein|tara:strand:+ start:163 stop:393 length:231 start_codon:yes stop_codon:yes gene_type:complete
MEIIRFLRPKGLPIIIEKIYVKHSGKLVSFKQYNLSPEPGELSPRKGEVEDFTMDSLRNQIIGEAIELPLDLAEND